MNSTAAWVKDNVGVSMMFYVGQLQYAALMMLTYNCYTAVRKPAQHNYVRIDKIIRRESQE